MIYWNEYDDYTIIENESLDSLAIKYDVILDVLDNVDDNVNSWFKYAQVTSKKNDFKPIYEYTFIYYVTEYLAEQGMSLGTEDKYFIKKIDERISKIYYDSTVNNVTEVDQKRAFYDSLVNFFKGDEIKSYERHRFQHNITVTSDIMEWFKTKGKLRETIKLLIDGQIEKPHLNTNIVGDNSLVFLLNYSDEIRWRQLSSLDDRDRLRVLLN